MADQDRTWTLARSPLRTPAAETARFLVLDGTSSSMFALPGEGSLFVGRAAEAELQLHDKSVSRRHAQVLVTHGEVQIADLGSHNGVLVNGERIAAVRALGPGDVVSIGEVTLVLYAAATAPTQALLDAGGLRQRLAGEVARALEYQRPLVVLAISLGGAVAREAVAQGLQGVLRLIDVAGWEDEGQLVVALPELGPSSLGEAVEAVRAALAALAPRLRVGLATCPADGCDAGALVAAARAAAAAATPGGKAEEAGRQVTEIRLGERVVVVADPAMARLYQLIRRLAASELPVLISGETGAGKENAAFAVHFWSPRAERPFVAINCAAIAENLVESELFGHEKGAFTGALAAKPGLFETAAGGTVFLDEIGELPAAAQAKLLRALEARRVLRVGGVKEREIDIRIVAATHRDLEREVGQGRFRKDLFFRLGAATVILPPLRDRPREVAVLAERFLALACEAAGRASMTLSPATLALLGRHSWPGNVRELKNTMEYVAAALGEEEAVVEPWHLPERVTAGRGGDAGAGEQALSAPGGGSEEAPGKSVPAASDGPEGQDGRAAGAVPSGGLQPRRERSLSEELRALERLRMAEALAATGGVKARAAEFLGMPIRTFTLKCKQYGL
ncbi:MAG TPA: sigma 54-interacting transcriptional regulator [Polyangia bacterium]|nr:sigma 54-interacting transcriptional regulator [Polyangia bacterium]